MGCCYDQDGSSVTGGNIITYFDCINNFTDPSAFDSQPQKAFGGVEEQGTTCFNGVFGGCCQASSQCTDLDFNECGQLSNMGFCGYAYMCTTANDCPNPPGGIGCNATSS